MSPFVAVRLPYHSWPVLVSFLGRLLARLPPTIANNRQQIYWPLQSSGLAIAARWPISSDPKILCSLLPPEPIHQIWAFDCGFAGITCFGRTFERAAIHHSSYVGQRRVNSIYNLRSQAGTARASSTSHGWRGIANRLLPPNNVQLIDDDWHSRSRSVIVHVSRQSVILLRNGYWALKLWVDYATW